MQIDFYILAAGFLFSLWGLWTGAFRQLIGLGLLISSFALSVLASNAFGHQVSRMLDVRTYIGPVVTGLAVFSSAFVLTRILAGFFWWLYRRKQDRAPLSWTSRGGGFLLGGAQAVLVAYVSLSWAAGADYETTLLCRRWKIQPDDSIGYRLAQRHSPAELLAMGTNAVAPTPPRPAPPTTAAPSPIKRALLVKDQAEESTRRRMRAAEAAAKE